MSTKCFESSFLVLSRYSPAFSHLPRYFCLYLCNPFFLILLHISPIFSSLPLRQKLKFCKLAIRKYKMETSHQYIALMVSIIEVNINQLKKTNKRKHSVPCRGYDNMKCVAKKPLISSEILSKSIISLAENIYDSIKMNSQISALIRLHDMLKAAMQNRFFL